MQTEEQHKITPWLVAERFLDLEAMGGRELVRERLLTANAHLWVSPERDAVAVTEVSDDNNLNLWSAGGNIANLLPFLPHVETFAVGMNCKAVEVPAVEPWASVLTDFGYQRDGDDMVKALPLVAH